MEINMVVFKGVQLAVIKTDHLILNDAQDAVELIANCQYNGAEKIIVYAENLGAAFFDLKTGLAGDVLQKFSTYRAQLAVIGDFSTVQSKSLRDFIYESNK